MKMWTETVPPAGEYWWRRSPLWEPVKRTIHPDGTCYSNRYENYVPAARLEGEWLV